MERQAPSRSSSEIFHCVIPPLHRIVPILHLEAPWSRRHRVPVVRCLVHIQEYPVRPRRFIMAPISTRVPIPQVHKSSHPLTRAPLFTSKLNDSFKHSPLSYSSMKFSVWQAPPGCFFRMELAGPAQPWHGCAVFRWKLPQCLPFPAFRYCECTKYT